MCLNVLLYHESKYEDVDEQEDVKRSKDSLERQSISQDLETASTSSEYIIIYILN